MKLYELTGEELRLQELINEVETDSDNDVVVELMEELEKELTKKGSGIIKAVKSTDNLISGVDDEIKRLQDYKKSLKNKQDRFKEYVVFCMEQMGIKKIETNLGVISTRKGSVSVFVEDEGKIPTEYIKIKETKSVDKTSIKKALKDGLEVAGVSLKEGNSSLTIK